MDQKEKGRLSVIYQHLDIWGKLDPEYMNKAEFIAEMDNCDLGCYPVKDTEKWLKLRKEARSKNVTIVELLFDHWSSLADKQISIHKESDRPLQVEVDVVDLEMKKELEDITQRLKRADPARRK